MVVNGPPLVGKSTTIHRLVHNSSDVVPYINLPSSQICEKPLTVKIKEVSQTRVSVGSSWVKQSSEDEQDHIARESLSLVESPEVQGLNTIEPLSSRESETHALPDSAQRPQMSVAHSIDHPQVTTDDTRLRISPLSQEGSSEPSSNPTPPTPSQESMPSFDSPDDIIRRALRRIDALHHTNDLKGSTALQIIDTGGQPEFLEVLAMLLIAPSINIQVFRLDQKLDQRYLVKFVTEVGTTTRPYFSSYTVEEAIFQALSCVAFLRPAPACPPQLPIDVPVSHSVSTLFVGTHRDRVSDEDFCRIDETLQKKLPKCSSPPGNNICYYSNPENNDVHVVIPVDNTKVEKSGIELLQRKVNDILEEKVKSHEVPYQWEMFKQVVLSTGAKSVTVEQCAVIGKECGMEGRDEVLLAMWYYTHYTGQLRHYANIKGLEDIVILDPQVFSDAMTTLIKSAFYWEKSFFKSEERGYRETGMYPVAEVSWLLQKANCGKIPHQKLIALFEHVHIFSPITDSEGKVVKYFIPCVLKSAEVEKIKRPSALDSEEDRAHFKLHPEALLFVFSSGYTPIGVFPALIVHLSSPCLEAPWELCKSKVALFRNKVTFIVGEDFDEVTLIARPTCYEVWIDRQDNTDCSRPLADVCSNVRSTIDKALTHVKNSSLNSSIQIPHRVAFYCKRKPKCQEEPHFADPKGWPPKNAVCSSSKLPCKLGQFQRIWYSTEVCNSEHNLC